MVKYGKYDVFHFENEEDKQEDHGWYRAIQQ